MPTFLIMSRHSPENCPLYNEKVRKAALASIPKFDELSKKHGGKVVGAWSVHSEHLNVMVLEAPTVDAFQKVMMEPEVLAITATETYEVKLALNMSDVLNMLKQAK
jgi:hypothetical protein